MRAIDPICLSSASAPSGWRARLDLRFAARDGPTRLVSNRHEGPLRLMKALPGPGPDDPLEVIVLHPPGGLAGGDEVSVALDLGAGSRVVATTPGAQKWYRKGSVGAGRAPATARSRLTLAPGASLEWLPQPAILYDRADARQRLDITLAAGATCIGWEILILGRAAMGERFTTGRIEQSFRLAVDGRLWWQDRLVADAGDRLFESPVGWRGRTVAATVWACRPPGAASAEAAAGAVRGPDAADADLLERWRSPLPDGVLAAASRVTPGLVLARLLADDSEAVFAACQSLWRVARNALIGRDGDPPRIWTT